MRAKKETRDSGSLHVTSRAFLQLKCSMSWTLSDKLNQCNLCLAPLHFSQLHCVTETRRKKWMENRPYIACFSNKRVQIHFTDGRWSKNFISDAPVRCYNHLLFVYCVHVRKIAVDLPKSDSVPICALLLNRIKCFKISIFLFGRT